MAKRGLGGGVRTMLLAHGILLAGAGAAFAAPDQNTSAPAAGAAVSEVVVTATKRAVSVEKVPFTVTALGQADLKARGAQTIDQAINYVPGVNFTSNGTGGGAYTIRGVNTSTYIAGTQSPVALYIDDINILDPFFPKVTPNLPTFDINRVEVLEGPQGTLFGSGSLGGAIRVISNKPDSTRFQAETEDTVESVDGGGIGYNFNAMVNVPLIQDRLALRVVGYYDQEPGWVDNTARKETDVNRAISEGGRAELKWTPTEDLTIIGSALFGSDRPHDSPFSYYNNKLYQWNGLVSNTNYDRTNIYSISGVYNLHWATLTSISTYSDRQENIQADFSFDAGALLGLFVPSPVNDIGPSRTFSQEVRLASPDSGRFRWLIGGIYIDNHRDVLEPIPVPGSGALFGAPSDIVSLSNEQVEVREEALFGEVSYDILPELTATAGVRAFQDRLIKFQQIGGTFNPPSSNHQNVGESQATPKFNLTWHVAPTSLVYVQAAEGYRIGQTNPVPDDPISHEPIPAASSPDQLWNYELGEKSTFLDGRLLLNAAIYYIDWRNIQLNELTKPSGINFIGNAGDAVIKGLELEVDAKPIPAVEIGGSLSLNDARLVTINPTVAATKGDHLPGSAPVTVVLFAQYTHPLANDASLFVRVDGRWIGKEYSNLMNATSLTYGDYSTLNLRAGVNWGRYAVTGFVSNAFNTDSKTAAFEFLGQEAAIRQQPVTFGLTLDARL
ncbi:MAG TPA: TonB-dependent receptor [Caulobacteraceae bacterium]